MEVVPPEALIEDIGELQARCQTEDQGDVVDTFMVQDVHMGASATSRGYPVACSTV